MPITCVLLAQSPSGEKIVVTFVDQLKLGDYV